MKQEVVIAIVGGFLIGAAAAFGVVQLSSRMKTSPQTADTAEPTPSPVSTSPTTSQTDTAAGGGTLEIIEPKDDSVTETKTAKLSGRTKPGNSVVVVTDADTIAKRASDDGAFSANVTLQEGNNAISVYSYDDKGIATSKTVSVFYTSQKL